MRLYHPLMFMGLGGTGCKVGAELERRMRDEICGPDGTGFRAHRPDALRYELPRCVQFVYADVNQIELARQARRVVPGEEHIPANYPTTRLVRGLVRPSTPTPDSPAACGCRRTRRSPAGCPGALRNRACSR